MRTLRALREAWYINNSTLVSSVPVTAASSHALDMTPSFDEAAYFTNIYRAHEYCIFKMACILYFLLYQDLSSGNVQPVEDILPGLFPDGTIQSLVRNICRCSQYLLLEQHGSRGYIVLQLPVTIAYLASDKNSLEAKWLYGMCKRYARSSGFGWGDYAMDQVTPLSQWMASCRDRHRNHQAKGHLAVAQPSWRVDSDERFVDCHTSHSDTSLPLRASGSLGEARRNTS